ncbi:MAG: DegQ family serine endoprotease [Magnetococcales bacterium]|nr:DegQ family serine endoprotease [Magnetococcales bacterium]
MKQTWTLLACSLALSASLTQAALPLAVDGQPLPSLAPMVERVTPAVVNISTSTVIQVAEHPLFSDPFFRKFFDLPTRQSKPREKKEKSLGSGVVVDAKNGYLVTNHHVIKNADRITVTLWDGRTLQGKRLGSDPETDIAMVKIPSDDLKAITLGNSEKLRVGDFVVAIGNPFGLGQTVTSGIVSAVGRRGLGIEGYEDFIQTDASINPGNSGGALVDLRGELVGINTAILAPGGGNVGIGFAIPVDMAKRLMAQLLQYGEVRRGLLGIKTQDLTPELAEAFGVDMRRHGLDGRHGAVVVSVVPNSSAQKAGIRNGDILLRVNGTPVEDSNHVRNSVGLARVGERLNIQLLRDGKVLEVNAEIGEVEKEQSKGEDIHPLLAGASLESTHSVDSEEGSILVTDVKRNSAASRIGLRKGDVLLAINKQKVASLEEIRPAIGDANALLLSIKRGNSVISILVQ